MKKIIYIIVVCLTMGMLSGCTQYNFDDTGLANGKHDMTCGNTSKVTAITGILSV